MKFSLFYALAIGSAVLVISAARRLEVWTTTGDRRIELRRTQVLQQNDYTKSGGSVELQVDVNQKAQTIAGFGAALTNAAAYNIYNSRSKNSLLADLFSSSGIDIGYVRLPLGGTDFQAVHPYTYNDLNSWDQDFNLDRFTINKDWEFILPLLTDISAQHPNFGILATPWSAPAWMKDNGRLNGGSLKNEWSYKRAFANYLVKAIEAYKKVGFEFDAMTIQNEPLHSSNDYPTMTMSKEQQMDIISNHLGPLMRKQGIKTKLLVYDHNWDNIDYARLILNDGHASQYVSGSAWHCYADAKYDIQPAQLKQQFPNKDIYFTECSGGFWAKNFWDNLYWNMHHVFFTQLRNGAKTVLLWNMALDIHSGPKVGVGGCNNCRGVVTVKSDGSYVRNEEYYIIGHFSKFMSRGTVIVRTNLSNGYGIEAAAGQRPDGTTAVVLMNSRKEDVTLTLKIGSTEYRGLFMPAESIASLSEVQ